MTISILRTADAWWVQTASGAARVDTDAATTAELLADRAAIDAAANSTDTVPVEQPCAAVPDHDAVPGGGSGHQLRLACQRRRPRPRQDAADLLPQGVRLGHRAVRRHRQAGARRSCWTTSWRSVW